MRILIVGLNYAPEPIGIGPYTTGLAEWLAARGHEVEVVAGRPYYPQWRAHRGFTAPVWRSARENGVGILRCPHYVPRQPSGARRIAHHLSFALAALPVVAWKALLAKPDVVIAIAPSLLSATVARLGAALAGGKLWLHLQDFEVDAAFATGLVRDKRLARLLRKAERAILRSAEIVSTISPTMVARLIEKGVPAERTYELRNWANATPAITRAYRREWGLEGKTVALYSGAISRKQGAPRCIGTQLASRPEPAIARSSPLQPIGPRRDRRGAESPNDGRISHQCACARNAGCRSASSAKSPEATIRPFST